MIKYEVAEFCLISFLRSRQISIPEIVIYQTNIYIPFVTLSKDAHKHLRLRGKLFPKNKHNKQCLVFILVHLFLSIFFHIGSTLDGSVSHKKKNGCIVTIRFQLT